MRSGTTSVQKILGEMKAYPGQNQCFPPARVTLTFGISEYVISIGTMLSGNCGAFQPVDAPPPTPLPDEEVDALLTSNCGATVKGNIRTMGLVISLTLLKRQREGSSIEISQDGREWLKSSER